MVEDILNPREQQRRFVFEGGRVTRLPEPSNLISFDFGSGVVIGDRGQILTMYHVVKGARELIVRAADRQEFDAEIIAADPRSDLAVIAPTENDGAEPPKLKPLAIGDAGKLRKGAFLIALGNSFNAARDGKPSASWGILSNIAASSTSDLDDTMNARPKTVRLLNYPTLLQLDSKLNLGMSGGAVINLKGELVGLTTMAASPAGFDAMAGYAIPMDKLGRRAVETLKEGKEIEYGLLGIKADANFTNRVGEVTPNSPAALGQLQAGDEIIAVNDTPVFDFDTLVLAVNVYSAGDTVRLKIRRGDETIERTVVLAKVAVDGEIIATNRPKPWRGLRVDYTSALNQPTFGPNVLDPALTGVVVAEVEEGSAGRRRGDQERPVDPQGRRPRASRIARATSHRSRRRTRGPRHTLQDRPRAPSRSNEFIMKTDELRDAFLDFFVAKGCVRRPSDVLVPNDPTVLFTPAGMNQFKKEFMGLGDPNFKRADHLPEMPAHRRHRQRRPDGLPRDFLRDAGEFQLRRLFQARGDPLGVGVLDAVAQDPGRSADDHGLPGRRRGVQHLARRDQGSREPDLPAGRGRQFLAGRCADAWAQRRVRAVLGDLLPWRRSQGSRNLEPGLHPVQPHRPGPARAPAQEKHRHRHGPGAGGGLPPGCRVGL